MKKAIGVYLMFAGILMGFYLVFNVYLPTRIAAHIPLPLQPAEAVGPAVQEERPLPVAAQEMQELPPNGEVTGYVDNQPADVIIEAKYERPRRKAKGHGEPFEIPHGLKKEVDFWIGIYTRYTVDQAVIHDPYDIGRIYGVAALPHCGEPPAKSCLKLREDKIQAEKERLAAKLGYIEPAGMRAQVGQKDRFEKGIIDSEKYLPMIEEIFDSYGIPKEITRLVFVESMFNLKAYSKSGAAGIWQLMPATARILGLKVGRGHDERYDPIKSTHAAAKHLVRDYNRLGTWPLAVNAYNSGPGRLADAVNRLGTKDIVRIIKRYDNPAYGFAARNFYPCFLAALNVYENRYSYFPEPAPLE